MNNKGTEKKTRDNKDYTFYGYTVTKDGDFYSPMGNKISWNKDGTHIKLNLDGKVKEFNGMKILYFLYHGLDEMPTSRYNVVLINPNETKNKKNLKLVARTYSSKAMFSDEEVVKIREEYGSAYVGRNNETRESFKNNDNHPTLSYRQLAEKYNTSLYTIESIIQGTYGRKQLQERLLAQ